MKKLIALLLVICIATGALSACVIIKDDKPLTTNDPNASNSASESTPGKNDPQQTKPNPGPAPEVSITEAVVYDENDIKITVTGIDNNSFWGKEIKFLVENNTDKNISVSGSTFVVNGITIYGMMNISVAAGKKTNDSLTLLSSDLDDAGIAEIATIDTYDLHIVDTDSYDTLHDISVSIKTSIGDTYTQAIDDSGDVVFEHSGITVVAQVISDSVYGKTVRLLVKNNNDKHIIIQAENISVNGFTISAWMYDEVCQGTVRFCELDLFSSGLEENGIKEIEEVTFTLKIIEDETYDPIAESEELKVFVKE